MSNNLYLAYHFAIGFAYFYINNHNYIYFSGKISIDGVDVKDLDPSWLRGRAIGYISQEPVLFATSIMENIRFGRPSATDQEVIEKPVS